MKFITLLFALCLCAASHAATNEINNLDWTLKKNKHGVKVYSAKVPGSAHHAYLAVTEINTNTEKLASIIRNPELCSQWVHRCSESYRHGQEGPNVDLIYTSTDMPFPLKARDTLARISWEAEPVTGIVRAVGHSTNNIMAPTPKHLRIEDATAIWELTPLANGRTQVRSYIHVDPKVKIPTALMNNLTTNVPIKTLKGLRELAMGGY